MENSQVSTSTLDPAPAARTRGRRLLWTEAGLALMVLIWGVNFAVAKWALDVFDPLGFNALRHVLASAFMLAVLQAGDGIGRPRREDWRSILFLGFAGNVLYQFAFILGLDRTTAGNASLMLAMVPIFLLLFGRTGRDRRLRSWVGALLSISGVAMVSGSTLWFEGTETLVGDVILLGAAALWGVYTLGAERLIERYGPIRSTAWTLWVGSVGLVIAGIPSLLRQDWGAVTPAAWGGLFFSSVLSIGVAYLLWYRGVQQVGNAHTAIFSNLTPVVALATGALWLGEPLTGYSMAGAAMVIGGLLLVRSTAVE